MSAAPSTFEISLCAPPSEKLEQLEINRQTQLSFENSLSAPDSSSSTWQTFWSTTTLSQFAPFHAVSQNSKGHFLKVLILSGNMLFLLCRDLFMSSATNALDYNRVWCLQFASARNFPAKFQQRSQLSTNFGQNNHYSKSGSMQEIYKKLRPMRSFILVSYL